MIYLIGLATFISTFLGGLFALRFKDKLHLILSFSAGAVLGVAFFDLLPETLTLTRDKYAISEITTVIALGFVLFMIIDRLALVYPHPDDECKNTAHRGPLAVAGLALHSMLDGVAIGLAFQVSSAVGLIITIAVLTHDFSDGINTVGLILKNKGEKNSALKWLTIDAIAPVVGITLTQFFSLDEPTLGLVFAVFCGFFIYLGASDLLPESHHEHSSIWNSVLTVAGMLVLYFAIKLAGL